MPKGAMGLSENEIELMETSTLGEGDDGDNTVVVNEPAPKAGGKAKTTDEVEYEFEGPPEEAEGTGGAKKPAAKKPGEETVPQQALHAEREERKRISRELENEKLSRVRLEERLSAVNSSLEQFARLRQQQEPKNEDVAPDYEADPMGAIAWQQRQILQIQQAEQQRQQQGQQQQQQTAEQQRQTNEFNTAYQAVSNYWNTARAADPTVGEAYDALLQNYTTELQALGYAGPALAAELQAIEARHIMNAYRNNIAIDKLVVSLAQARFGWKPKAAEEDPEEVAKNGTEQLKRLSAAKEASSSLSNSGGGRSGGNKLSLEALDRMPQKEFEKLIAKLSKSGEGAVDDALARMEGVR